MLVCVSFVFLFVTGIDCDVILAFPVVIFFSFSTVNWTVVVLRRPSCYIMWCMHFRAYSASKTTLGPISILLKLFVIRLQEFPIVPVWFVLFCHLFLIRQLRKAGLRGCYLSLVTSFILLFRDSTFKTCASTAHGTCRFVVRVVAVVVEECNVVT